MILNTNKWLGWNFYLNILYAQYDRFWWIPGKYPKCRETGRIDRVLKMSTCWITRPIDQRPLIRVLKLKHVKSESNVSNKSTKRKKVFFSFFFLVCFVVFPPPHFSSQLSSTVTSRSHSSSHKSQHSSSFCFNKGESLNQDTRKGEKKIDKKNLSLLTE